VHGVSPKPRVVLIVDDDEHVRRLMERVLQRAGHQVISCEGFEDAEARLLAGARPDLVITDVVLERATGSRVEGVVRLLSPRSRVVFVSGYDKVSVPNRVVLRKPFEPGELVDLVDEVTAAPTKADAIERGKRFEARRREKS
jgi:DNA-binding NtrC family response regulator